MKELSKIELLEINGGQAVPVVSDYAIVQAGYEVGYRIGRAIGQTIKDTASIMKALF